MIDKENELYTIIRNAIKAEYADADIDSSYQPVPSDFPHITFYQSDYKTPKSLEDTSGVPKFQDMTFEAQVYSNLKIGKKQEAKAIMKIIVDEMELRNFRLETMRSVPNVNDSSIFRLFARFEGRADANGFYRR